MVVFVTDALPKALLEARSNRTLVPFVGGGVSMAVCRTDGQPAFPNSVGLLERAAAELTEQHRPESAVVRAMLELSPPALVEAAAHAQRGLGALWPKFLRGVFDVARGDIDDASLDLARAVWDVGSKLVITTNCDRVLRWGCPDAADLDEWYIAAPGGRAEAPRRPLDRPTLWHLYGSIADPTGVIFSPDGYAQLYPEDSNGQATAYTSAIDTLRYLMSSHHLLFVGFSSADPNVLRQLEWVRDTFAGCGGPHYVLASKEDISGMRMLLEGLDVQFIQVNGVDQQDAWLRGLGGAKRSPAIVVPRQISPGKAEVVKTDGHRRKAIALVVACSAVVLITVGGWKLFGGGSEVPGPTQAKAPVEARLETPEPIPPAGMVLVRAGSFEMGSTDWERQYRDCVDLHGEMCREAMFRREAANAGRKQVGAFFMDEREVSVAELAGWLRKEIDGGSLSLSDREFLVHSDIVWARLQWPNGDEPFVVLEYDKDGLRAAAERESMPASMVTWSAARGYCEAQGKRLPTEVEWEYAARGPNSDVYPVKAGSPEGCDAFVYGRDATATGCSSKSKSPEKVGSSPFDLSWAGIRDLAGNVSEWVADAYVDDSTDVYLPCVGSAESSALDVRECRIFKGGSWSDPRMFARAAQRNVMDATPTKLADFKQPKGNGREILAPSVGFRCAADLSPKSDEE
jgi:formylglycine-generating enzyme required for sulfatase activity